MFLFGRAWRVWNAIVYRNTENFHFESRMGRGPSEFPDQKFESMEFDPRQFSRTLKAV